MRDLWAPRAQTTLKLPTGREGPGDTRAGKLGSERGAHTCGDPDTREPWAGGPLVSVFTSDSALTDKSHLPPSAGARPTLTVPGGPAKVDARGLG